MVELVMSLLPVGEIHQNVEGDLSHLQVIENKALADFVANLHTMLTSILDGYTIEIKAVKKNA